MPGDTAQKHGDHTTGQRLLVPVKDTAESSNKLLRLLATELLKLFRDKELPSELKLLLVPLLFMLPLYSLLVLIFLGHLTYCVARSQDFIIYHYLIFLAATGPPMLIFFLVYAHIESRVPSGMWLEFCAARSPAT